MNDQPCHLLRKPQWLLIHWLIQLRPFSKTFKVLHNGTIRFFRLSSHASPRNLISYHTHMLLGSYTFCHLLLSAWSAFPPSSLAEHLLILRNSLSFHHFFTQLSHIFALHPPLRMLPLEVFIVTVHRVQCPVLVLTFSILPSIWSSHPPLLSPPPTWLKRQDRPGLWQPWLYGHS